MRAALVAGLALVALAGCVGASPQAQPAPALTVSDGIGAFPTFLPSPPTGHLVPDATSASPALVRQGDAVHVTTTTGDAVVQVVGPSVPTPPPGEPPAEEVCTWTVVFTDVHGSVDTGPGTFSVIDKQGRTVPVRAAGPLTPAGYRLTASVLTGDGAMLWNPEGTKAPAVWDFVVEDD